MRVKRTRNSGFSLIELAITVMLMSVLAVALAPQVMKWVNNARLAADTQTRDSIVGFTKTALTDSEAYSQANGIVTLITIDNGSCIVNGTKDAAPVPIDKIAAAIAETSGLDYKMTGEVAYLNGLRTKTTGAQIIVKIQSGSVSSEMFGYDPDSSTELGVETVESPQVISNITGTVRGEVIGAPSATIIPGGYKGAGHENPSGVSLTIDHRDGQYYINDILVVRTAEDIAKIKVSADDAPVWVYVGDMENPNPAPADFVLYKWDGTVNEMNQPIWVKMHRNGLVP